MKKTAAERLEDARNNASLYMGLGALVLGGAALVPAVMARFGYGSWTPMLVAILCGIWVGCILVALVVRVAVSNVTDSDVRFVLYFGTCLVFILLGLVPESWGLILAQWAGLV